MCPLPNRSTISNFDGDNKVNYANLPPANQSLDWNNPLLAAATSDVAALGQTAPRCWARLTLAASTGAMVLLNWKAQWINVTPTTPVLARTATGLYTVTFPSVVSDEYDASVGVSNNITLNLSAAHCSPEGANFAFTSASASGNVITINTATSAGITPADLTCNVFVVGY